MDETTLLNVGLLLFLSGPVLSFLGMGFDWSPGPVFALLLGGPLIGMFFVIGSAAKQDERERNYCASRQLEYVSIRKSDGINCRDRNGRLYNFQGEPQS